MPLQILDKIHDTLGYLKSNGMDQLAKYVKKFYQANPYEDYYNSTMWQEQCLVNFPILYLASIYLYHYAKERNCDTFLFASRDCCHWYKVFQRMYPDMNVHYFQCSRNMFTNGIGNNSFQEYVTGIVKDIKKTIFIDLHGTGRRMFQYFEDEFGLVPCCFNLSARVDDYSGFTEITRKYYHKGRFINVVFDARGSPIEMLNYDLIGTLQNYSPTGPVRDNLEYEKKRVKPYHVCIDYILEHLKPCKEVYSPRLLDKAINHLFVSITDEKPIVSKYILHQGSHDENFEIENLVDNVTFSEIISKDSIHGVVWSGTYDQSPCAVKIIIGDRHAFEKVSTSKYYQELIGKKSMLKKDFDNEVAQLARLSLLQLAPKFHGYQVKNGCGHLVMEKVDCSLKDIIIHRNLISSEIDLIDQLIKDLHKHAVHGDLKPSNIGVILDGDERITKCYVLDCQKVSTKDNYNDDVYRKLVKKDWEKFNIHFKKNKLESRYVH